MTTYFTVFILEGQCNLTLLTDSGKIRLIELEWNDSAKQERNYWLVYAFS